MTRIGRREFISAIARAGAGSLALGSLPRWAHSAIAAASTHAAAPKRALALPRPHAGPAELIERNDWPEHWETTLEGLGHSWITRNDRFFVRSHFPAPQVDAASWRLEVAGLVAAPLKLALGEIRGFQSVTEAHTLECAGNGRGLFQLPSTAGTQWGYGAVGNAAWGGVRLSDVLDRARIKPEAKHVWFEAADLATLPTAPRFIRSIPIEKAMKDVLLAHTMNNQPLPRLHGAPLRAIVPGWYGMASTKWVTRIRLEAAPSDNHFMVKGYRYAYPGEDPTQAKPVEEMRVKSIITRPIDGTRVPLGRVRVQGFAWAGSVGVKNVEISIDGGKTWRFAGFMGDVAPLAWRMWVTEIEIKSPAQLTIMARATDKAGEAQPIAAQANGGGYGNNSIHEVKVRVGA